MLFWGVADLNDPVMWYDRHRLWLLKQCPVGLLLGLCEGLSLILPVYPKRAKCEWLLRATQAKSSARWLNGEKKSTIYQSLLWKLPSVIGLSAWTWLSAMTRLTVLWRIPRGSLTGGRWVSRMTWILSVCCTGGGGSNVATHNQVSSWNTQRIDARRIGQGIVPLAKFLLFAREQDRLHSRQWPLENCIALLECNVESDLQYWVVQSMVEIIRLQNVSLSGRSSSGVFR